jgi:hypothetical protein
MQKDSEIARLKAQIALEIEAGHRGMYGLALGMTKHDFISARMEHMGILHERLTDLIGRTEATGYLVQAMDDTTPSKLHQGSFPANG